MNLDAPFAISHFMTLAKTKSARLCGDEIVGRFAESKPLFLANAKTVCERFANCDGSGEAVLKFTRTYGPLNIAVAPGKLFRFQLDEWQKAQSEFLWTWRTTTPSMLPELEKLGVASRKQIGRIAFLEGCYLRVSRQGNRLGAEKLSTLLNICMAAIPVERLRVCPAKGCTKPYFVAHHLKQTLCGADKCKAWNGKRLKREYWAREKGPILAARKLARKGERNGTQKAR